MYRKLESPSWSADRMPQNPEGTVVFVSKMHDRLTAVSSDGKVYGAARFPEPGSGLATMTDAMEDAARDATFSLAKFFGDIKPLVD
jgi:hypothetical protein